MYCSKCGNLIDESLNGEFCPKCGNNLKGNVEEKSENVSEIVENPVQQVETSNEVVENEIPKVEEVSEEVKLKRKKKLRLAIILTCGIGTILGWICTFLIFGSLAKSIIGLEKDEEDFQKLYENVNNMMNENKTEDEGQRIGSDEYGYVTVPKNWTKFYDVDGNGTIQYSYANTWIATVYGVDSDLIDAESYAQGLKESLEGDEISDVVVDHVNVNGYNAYKVSCYYEDYGVYLTCWTIDSKNSDKTYYIAVEGPRKDSKYFTDIINTFGEDE